VVLVATPVEDGLGDSGFLGTLAEQLPHLGRRVDGQRGTTQIRFLGRSGSDGTALDVVDELGSRREVEHVRTILKNGTSADRQLRVYTQHGGDDNREEALRAVVDNLVKETQEGIYD